MEGGMDYDEKLLRARRLLQELADISQTHAMEASFRVEADASTEAWLRRVESLANTVEKSVELTALLVELEAVTDDGYRKRVLRTALEDMLDTTRSYPTMLRIAVAGLRKATV